MNKGDRIVEGAAEKVEDLSAKAASGDGVTAKVAEPLADDADFLRKLKPSLMVARARGDAPKNEKPGSKRHAPAGPQLTKRPKGAKKGGPNPFVVIAAAFALGIVLAKIVDWRGHAHPRD
jgi:hypothetical protein